MRWPMKPKRHGDGPYTFLSSQFEQKLSKKCRYTLAYFGTKIPHAQKEYRAFVEAMIAYEYRSPLRDVVG